MKGLVQVYKLWGTGARGATSRVQVQEIEKQEVSSQI